MSYVLHRERERIGNKENISNSRENRPITKSFPQLFPAENGSTGVVLNAADAKKKTKKSTQAPPQFPDGLGNINRAAGGEGEEAPSRCAASCFSPAAKAGSLQSKLQSYLEAFNLSREPQSSASRLS